MSEPTSLGESAPKKGESKESQESSPEVIDLKYGASAVISVTIPVSVCMILVIISVNTLEKYTDPKAGHFSVYAPFNTKGAGSARKILDTLLNVIIIVIVITVLTFILFILYKFRYYKILNGYMMFVTFVLILFFGVLYARDCLTRMNSPVDYISIVFIFWNLVVLAEIAIHYNGPLLLQQTMLVLVSVLMALQFIKNLPDWTGWALLVAVSIYDLYAVLTPHGPLSMLVNLAQERNEDFFPALIYSSGMLWGLHLGTAMAHSDGADEATPSPPQEQRRSSGIKLGLGDFIFYSILVGKASVFGDWGVILACYTSIIVGLCLTLLLLVVFRRALPALPISIALALIMFCGANYAIAPFMDAAVGHQVTL